MELILEKLSALDCIPKQLAELTVKVSEVQKCVEYNSGQLDEVLQTSTEHGEEIKRLKSELQKQTKVNHDLTKRMSEIEERQIQHELYSRKNSLLFDGIRETEDEDCLKIVSDLITNILKLPVDARDFDKIHRIGIKFNAGRTRPILVRFTRHCTHDAIYQARAALYKSKTNIWINEDLPGEIKQRRTVLNNVVKYAKTNGHVAMAKSDAAIIDGTKYSSRALHLLPAHLTVEKAATPLINPTTIAFFSEHSPLLNFYHSPMTVDGIIYNCNEQYFQHTKATLNGDDVSATKIMLQTKPSEMKKTGNGVTIKLGSSWNKECTQVMMKGCSAKFQQNAKLKDFLNDTGDTTLVEAGRDRFWGAGTHLHSAELKMNTWSGQHLLGKTLMDVREKI